LAWGWIRAGEIRVMAAVPVVLVVDDEFLIALEMQMLVEGCGCRVIGPAATVAEALKFVRLVRLDGAVLDVSLARNEVVWPVAQALDKLGVPYLLVTGHGPGNVPADFRDRPMISKPVDAGTLRHKLASLGLCPLLATCPT